MSRVRNVVRDVVRDVAYSVIDGPYVGAAFSPLDLANLVLWLDADDASTITLNGSDVSQWDDKSAQGNNFAQLSAVLQPAYVTGVVNGKAVLRGAGTEYLTSATEVINQASEPIGTIFVVANNASAASSAYVINTRDIISGGWYLRYNSSLTTLAFQTFPGGTVVTHAMAADGFNILEARISTGIMIELGSNGTLETPFDESAWAQSTAGSAIFVRSNNEDFPFTGDIAEIIVYERALSDSEMAQVEAYLSLKYAITLS